MHKLIEVSQLVKAFNGHKAVDGVTFDILSGEIFGLLGPNGAGKSTTIKMVCGLLRPDQGDITIDGASITKNPLRIKTLMGLVPQDIALYPTLSARENLHFWGRMYGLTGAGVRHRTEEVLEIVGLSDRANDRVDSYSGGMKRRINIAAALLHKPKILIMDEPTVGIDPQSRNHILDTIIKLNKEGMTVIYTSHYMEEVEKLCRRLAIIDHGRVIAMGSKEEICRLEGDHDEISIEAEHLPDNLVGSLSAMPGVLQVNPDGEKHLQLICQKASEVTAAIVSVLDREAVKISSIRVKEPNLESVFLSLTGRALRD